MKCLRGKFEDFKFLKKQFLFCSEEIMIRSILSQIVNQFGFPEASCRGPLPRFK